MAKPGPGFITTGDGVKIAYEYLPCKRTAPTVVLIHGWSGSRHYFDRNIQALAKHAHVYAVDLRFHGESGRPSWGYHIARLAADIRDFLVSLELSDVTIVGTSMGAAVIWSYVELYGVDRLGKAVFVDQAPLQNNAEDWRAGSRGCYDSASLARLQMRLRLDFPAFATATVAECASPALGASVAKALAQETLNADPAALARLMADHTQLDWRPVLPRVSIPSLVVIGRKSSVFPEEGVRVVGDLLPVSHTVYFEEGNHWLYVEEPEKFSNLIATFALSGINGVIQQTAT
eukprot:jgi/Botrbrau1/6017/Bobra.0042s0003.1